MARARCVTQRVFSSFEETVLTLAALTVHAN